MVLNAKDYSIIGIRSGHHDVSVNELRFRRPGTSFVNVL